MSTLSTTLPRSDHTTGPLDFDAAQWRLRIAGLIDPESTATGGDESPSKARYKSLGSDLCVVLCLLYGKALDRKKLWDRIPTAIASACTKVDDGDMDQLLNLMLDHIKADPGQAGRSVEFAALLYALNTETLAWRQGFVRYLVRTGYSLIVHGRTAWEDLKQRNADARALEVGGTLSTGEVVEIGAEL